jgi:hypothetical protein
VFAGDLEWEAPEMRLISELPASGAAVGGTGSVLMLEGASIPALSMDSSDENDPLALAVPEGGVLVSSPDSKYEACGCVSLQRSA